VSWALVIHHVDDFDGWRRIFDEAEGLRRAAGEREYRVLCAANDRNDVVHLSRWTSIEAARNFFESPEVVAIRARAGVHPPQFLYLEQIASGLLDP
jgi:heme-degrading monooxygenase HmoA